MNISINQLQKLIIYKSKITQKMKNISVNKQNLQIRDDKFILLKIYLGQYLINLRLPKIMKIIQLNRIIAAYKYLHSLYGPINHQYSYLSSFTNNITLDYWLTQSQKTLEYINNNEILQAVYIKQSTHNQNQYLNIDQLQFLKKMDNQNIFLVRISKNSKIYLLKQYAKKQITAYNILEDILIQKKSAMKLSKNAYTIQYLCSFESKDHFNFLLQYPMFGTLISFVKNKKMDKELIKIIFCEILVDYQYLLNNQIYDISFEIQNFVIDISGHIKINSLQRYQNTQFKKIMQKLLYFDQKINNLNDPIIASFINLGIILYELITGVYKMDTRILQLLLINPQYIYSKISQQYDSNLLNVLFRLFSINTDYCYQSLAELKQQYWFSNIVWQQIEKRTNKPIIQVNLYKQYFKFQNNIIQINQNIKFQPIQDYFYYSRFSPIQNHHQIQFEIQSSQDQQQSYIQKQRQIDYYIYSSKKTKQKYISHSDWKNKNQNEARSIKNTLKISNNTKQKRPKVKSLTYNKKSKSIIAKKKQCIKI